MARSALPSSGPPGFIEPTFGQRLIGGVLDGLVLLPVALLFEVLGRGPAVDIAGFALASAYYVGLTARNGQTVAKRVVGTRVVDRATGMVPSVRQAVLRWLVLGAGGLVAASIPLEAAGPVYTAVVLGGVLFQPLHRGLHDRAAGTVVTALHLVTP